MRYLFATGGTYMLRPPPLCARSTCVALWLASSLSIVNFCLITSVLYLSERCYVSFIVIESTIHCLCSSVNLVLLGLTIASRLSTLWPLYLHRLRIVDVVDSLRPTFLAIWPVGMDGFGAGCVSERFCSHTTSSFCDCVILLRNFSFGSTWFILYVFVDNGL